MHVNEAGKESKRFFAITSLSKNRWYWVVWPSLRELQTSDQPLFHVAEGMEETKAEAVEKALELAGRYATWIAGKYAKSYHQKTKARTTKHSADVPVLHEFLYRDIYDAGTRQWKSAPHRIVRRTKNYIYVDQFPYTDEGLTGSWLEEEPPTYRLDRQALEGQGYAFIPATAELTDQEEPVFFISQANTWRGDEVPVCLQVLHLSWPCTVTEVQEAYRRLVKNAHPDGGGSHDQFIELQAAYEQALRLCRKEGE